MADAKKCDRCGRLYEPYHCKDDALMPRLGSGNSVNCIKFYNELQSHRIGGQTVDLCPECMAALIAWLRSSELDELRAKTVKALRGLRVESGSLACLWCKAEDGCSINGCAIIGDAIRLLSVSNLDTSTQATDSLGQSMSGGEQHE